MRSFDPYEVLDVPRDADGATIRRAYQKLARRHHPDLAPGDREAERRFDRIQRAYRVLGDPERRRRFDEGRARRPTHSTGGGARRTSVATGRLGVEGFLEVREEWMEWIEAPLPRSAEESLEADVRAEVTLSFAEAVRGCVASLTVQRERPCEACDGGTRAGAGSCQRCSGKGTVVDLDRLRVRVPAGVENGARLRLSGKGGSPAEGKGAKGDLFLTVRVQPHPYFRRDGLDVHAELPVTFAEAVTGTELRVPTIDGPVRVRLPPGTQGGQRFRLEGRGVRRKEGPVERLGDHYYTVRILVPKGPLGPDERAALETLDRLPLASREVEPTDRNPRSLLPTRLE